MERSLQNLVGRRVAICAPGAREPETLVHGVVTEILAGTPPVLVIDAGGAPNKIFWVPLQAPFFVAIDP